MPVSMPLAAGGDELSTTAADEQDALGPLNP